jgi:hypothetical protein
LDFGAIFSAIVGIINLIPVVKGWIDSFIAYYVGKQIESMKAENMAAIRKAVHEQDQRDAERALGNPQAGEPSDIPGTVIRDSLPGVSNPKGSSGNGVAQ